MERGVEINKAQRKFHCALFIIKHLSELVEDNLQT